MKKHRLLLITLLSLVAIVATSGVVIAREMAGLGSAPAAAPQVGTAFSYQGRLQQSGSPANGEFDFQFALFDAASSGGQVGSDFVTNDVSVSDGLFTVELDFGATAFTGDARWLEIEVREGASTGSFTLLSPRQQLTPTPYAIFTPNAWSTTGNSGTLAGTNFLGTTDSQPMAFIANNTEAMRIDSAGNVGIGTTNPTSALDVFGDITISSNGFNAPDNIKIETELDLIVHQNTPLIDVLSENYPYVLRLLVGDNPGAAGSDPWKVDALGNIIASGSLELPATTATTGMIKSGGNRLIHSFGTDNFFAGENAGNLATTGPGSNTGVGVNALQSNTTGADNTATGAAALQSNTTGINNTATGALALTSNTTGGGNTAVGESALQDNTTGENNTATGFNTLENNTTGSSNTAVGTAALQQNTTGNQNTATGVNALQSNTTGTHNTASGALALGLNTTGINNTASGFQALQLNTTGDFNTASGANALFSNTTGSGNTAAGSDALQQNTTGNFNTATGSSALASNTTGDDNTAVGPSALSSNTIGGSNTASGRNALVTNTTGFNNTAVGFRADVSAGDLSNATAIGSGAVVDASNKIRLGDSGVTVIEGQVAFTSSSDVNLKENFRPVDGEQTLEKISQLTLESWNFKGHDPLEFRHYGPTAQEFFAAFGDDGFGVVGTETTINSGDMAGIMMVAIQALEQRTADLTAQQAQITELEQLVEDQQAQLQQMDERLQSRGSPTGAADDDKSPGLPSLSGLLSWMFLGTIVPGVALVGGWWWVKRPRSGLGY